MSDVDFTTFIELPPKGDPTTANACLWVVDHDQPDLSKGWGFALTTYFALGWFDD